MPPLNPFLRAFFRSALPSQCLPIQNHVLLVPTTEVLLGSKDRETNVSYAELAGSEEFLASHVLRMPGGGPPQGRDGGNARENKSKAKQYSTINGRTVVVKEAFVYSNKGFKTLNQALLLNDAIYYPDVSDGQQWLIYYISRPLIGTYQSTPTIPAVISDEPSKERRKLLAEASGSSNSNLVADPVLPKKKDIKGFGDLLAQFPMISRQLQPGLEKVIREFVAINDQPIPRRSSRRSSFSSQRSSQSMSESVSSLKSSLSGSTTVHPTALELAPEEDTMRTSLETAITAAIDLFQNVDKTQLSLLGANTELTGPVVERMIERYVTEQIHDQTLFPRVCAVRKAEDGDLDSKIRKMTDVDVAQVGIPIEEGMKGKREMAVRLQKGIDAFKRMGVASSPQEMLDILLNTQKLITSAEENKNGNTESGVDGLKEPLANLTINADVLVSMLLIVVIRSSVRHLHSRLLCMRYFIFIDEVEVGEQGYALATLEAVLSILSGDSKALRRASKANRALWQAARSGEVQALEAILQSDAMTDGDGSTVEAHLPDEEGSSDDTLESPGQTAIHEAEYAYLESTSVDNFAAVGGSLGHVFPFQQPPTPPPEPPAGKTKKRVSMAVRSQSQSSSFSSHSLSRTKSTDSVTSSSPGGSDISVEKLAQTQDADGNSLLMMAVEAGSRPALKFLLSMPAQFRADFVLDDLNNESTTLLSAAVQSGDRSLADELVAYLDVHVTEEQLERYLSVQDSKGRCVAHYLFNQPSLIQRFGKKLPWRLKDKNGQTPLFALCRSYDHEQYHMMVDHALALAAAVQGDGQALHLDDHVDAKGNTLLHIVNDVQITLKLLRHCDSDVNAANDRRFTPLMVSSKYGRLDLVRALFGDPRTDMALKDVRGLTAVELAKDDDVRNKIDDLVLLSASVGEDSRTTKVVRSFFVDDATVRFVLKSAAKNENGTITVTTCRRTVADFENLTKWLSIECPASWLPTHFILPSPFLIPSKPSRAVLRDIQIRLDNFFRNLLTHSTFATHEMVWEFFLVPDIDADLLLERSKRKAEARVENVKDDYEPVTDTAEVESFIAYAREQIKGVAQAVRRSVRQVNQARMRQNDLSEAANIASNTVSTLNFLPQPYLTAYQRYTKTLVPSETSPMAGLYYAFHSIHSTMLAMQNALNRPAYLIANMNALQRTLTKTSNALTRSTRWTPNIPLFDDARRANQQEAWDKAAKARAELESIGCELRYTQQTVASELAGWQEEHVKVGRATLKKLASDMVVKERARLEGMKRALREIRKLKPLSEMKM